ncbi:hypothetical protein [Nocardioides panaciterrulae]|uniref:Uncharacterized protein n=1 Tax=Nocardioides panaciterrulae TaxID=661492 RepID=A0A7Y9E8Q6_9ACTN|nr:hypothetical protein [Nocardioides panaciterrulae]NYD43230.1 hypothetical protein [Nocardioides panaciterrulae]
MKIRGSARRASAVEAVLRISFAAMAAVAAVDALHSLWAVAVGLVVLVLPVRFHKETVGVAAPTTVRDILQLMSSFRWAGLLTTLLVGGAALALWRGWVTSAAIAAIWVLTVSALLPAATHDARRPAQEI